MTRRPDAVRALREAGAHVVQGDLLDPSSLIHACAGVDAVVAAAHSMFGRGRLASVHVDRDGHRRLIDVAREAGVGHFVYTSVYDHGPAYRAIPFFRIKFDVEEYLRSSGLSHTILRPTAFMEVHAHALIGAAVLANRRVVLFGRGEQPRNFVAADDVAHCVVKALDDPSLAGQVVDIGGPENLTNLDVVRVYERVSGLGAKVTHVPLNVLRVASALLRPLHPGVSQVLQAAVLADIVPQEFDAQPLQVRLGLALTRLEDWVSQRLAGSRKSTV
jgi:NADH dehydrogenase